MIYFNSAFSINMVNLEEFELEVKPVNEDRFAVKVVDLDHFINEVPYEEKWNEDMWTYDIKFTLGHQACVKYVNDLIGKEVFEFERNNITLEKGDLLYVVQYSGPRLAEGEVLEELPEGSSYKLYSVWVK